MYERALPKESSHFYQLIRLSEECVGCNFFRPAVGNGGKGRSPSSHAGSDSLLTHTKG